MWLLASVSLLLCCQECTTVVVPCLDWWEIAGRDTTGTRFHPLVALLRLIHGSPLMFCIWAHFGSDLLGLWGRHWKGLAIADMFGTPIVSWWRAEFQFPVAYPLFFPRALPQSTGPVLGCLQIAWAGPSAGWTGFCCMHHRDRLPQPLLLISSGIIRSRHMQTQLHFLMFSKGIVIESADFMTWPFWTLSLTFVSRVNVFAKMVSQKKCMWTAVRMLVSDCINHLWGEPLMTYCSGLEKLDPTRKGVVYWALTTLFLAHNAW